MGKPNGKPQRNPMETIGNQKENAKKPIGKTQRRTIKKRKSNVKPQGYRWKTIEVSAENIGNSQTTTKQLI